jgi:hypothetical protein
MRKEFGKWLMDIAKYIATAVILTSVFGDIENRLVLYTIALISVVILLCSGLILVRDIKQKGE